jgi:hypothetical protein
MITRKIFSRLIGIALAASFILSACNTAATTVAPATSLPTQTALPLPVQPSATATPLPTATETPIPTVAATVTPPATVATTVQSVAQVIPSVNAYCRKGPGTDYDAITYLASGTAYNVIGRNSLNTWWLVQAPGNVSCWTGASGTNQLGPVAQAAIVLVPPALLAPAGFVGSYICDTTKHTLGVSLNWAVVEKATGYNLYLNGVLLAEVGSTTYHNNAPLSIDLVYELEAFDDYSVSPRVLVRVPACD